MKSWIHPLASRRPVPMLVFALYLCSTPANAGVIHLSEGTKCGALYRYVDKGLISTDAQCRPAGRCVTYSLSPPQDDAETIREAFTATDGWTPSARKVISTDRIIEREDLVPLPFRVKSEVLFSLLALPSTPLDLLTTADALGNIGDYVVYRGDKSYCGPFHFTPFTKERELKNDVQQLPRDDPKSGNGAYLCNDSDDLRSLASLTEAWKYWDAFDPSKQFIIRGWFNMAPGECINVTGLMGFAGTVMLFVQNQNGVPLEFDQNPNIRIQSKTETSWSGYRDQPIPICIKRGGSFRASFSTEESFETCPVGMEKVHLSMILKHPMHDRRSHTFSLQ